MSAPGWAAYGRQIEWATTMEDTVDLAEAEALLLHASEPETAPSAALASCAVSQQQQQLSPPPPPLPQTAVAAVGDNQVDAQDRVRHERARRLSVLRWKSAETAASVTQVTGGKATNEEGELVRVRRHVDYDMELTLVISGEWGGVVVGGQQTWATESQQDDDADEEVGSSPPGRVDKEALPRWRISAGTIASSRPMEGVILVAIVVNTAVLAVNHPGAAETEQSATQSGWQVIELTLTGIFTVEMFIRVAAEGFWTPVSRYRPAYIFGGWNQLDFFVVATAWLSLLVQLVSDKKGALEFSALRALRILRVVKGVRMFSDVQAILKTLVRSVGGSASILLFLGFIFIVGGVVGVQLFKGMLLYQCSPTPPAPDATGFDWEPGMGLGLQHTPCYPAIGAPNLCDTATGGIGHGGDADVRAPPPPSQPCWDAPSCPAGSRCYEFGNPGFGHHGFDNIVMSWMTLFIMMTQLYWWETAYRIEAAAAQDSIAGLLAWPIFFLVVILLSFFAVNVFVAIVTTTYSIAREEQANDEVTATKQGKKAVALVHLMHAQRSPPPAVQDHDVLVKFSGKESVGELLERIQSKFQTPKALGASVLYWGQMLEVVDASAAATKASSSSSLTAALEKHVGVSEEVQPKRLVLGQDVCGYQTKMMLPEEDTAWYFKQSRIANAVRRKRDAERRRCVPVCLRARPLYCWRYYGSSLL